MPAATAAARTIVWRLRVHEEIASTQDLLLRRAEAGAAEGLAILARRQTGGRGRDGRAWASPAGNLHLSVLLRPLVPAREATGWALLAAVALAETAVSLLDDPRRLRLKWPNDMLLDGAKCAGVLCEAAAAPCSDGGGAGLAWVALGIGVNLAHAPALPDGRPTASLAGATGAPPPPPEAFAARLLARLGHWHRRRLAEGFAPVRDAWLARGPAPEARLTVRDRGPAAGGDGPAGERLVSGRFAGLGEDGRLLLATGGRIRAVATGEVLQAG